MSGLVGIFAGDAATRLHAEAMLRTTRDRGPDHQQLWLEAGDAAGVVRHAWELGDDFAGDVLVLATDRVVVAADASLYYREELRQALAAQGVTAAHDTPSHLIAAAYLAWGEDCVRHLEGDFSFLLWDRRERRLLAARDLTGSRPLFFARAGSALVLASGLRAVVDTPGVSRQLNQLAIAETALSAATLAVEETEYAAVRRVPAGWSLHWREGSEPQLRRVHEGPRFDSGKQVSLEEGARGLRQVLGQAVGERLAREGMSSVWMSGGYDSPSIFALARHATSGGQQVRPVSMSYPEGDSGREDDLIQRVADFHQSSVEWVRIGDVPGHDAMAAWADRRDEPFAHPYEPWNRTLARGSRQAGARIALSGNGGDQFFSVSPVFLSDLLRTGRWVSLVREARALGFRPRGYRELVHWAVQPTLPAAAHRLIGLVRGGRPLRPHLQSVYPDWLRADRTLRQRLRDREWHYHHRRPDEPMSSAESNWYLDTNFGQRVSGLVSTIALGEGVEVRSPMFDPRVLRFLATRARAERFTLGENKLLLRQAVTGLLPPEHLERRRKRTGLPGGYLARALPATLRSGWEGIRDGLRLAELEIVDPGRLEATFQRYFRSPERESNQGAQLFEILAVEYWLRARHGAAG